MSDSGATALEARLKEAEEGLGDVSKLSTNSPPPAAALESLRSVALGDPTNSDAEVAKIKDRAIQKLSDVFYAAVGNAEAVAGLLTELRPSFATLPKAKTAKIVRTVIDTMAKVPDSTQLQLEVCKEQVEWAKQEKRTFLRQRIEARLANLYLEIRDFTSALSLISTLLTEVKRLDDKLLLVDIHLLESRVHHALRNLPKAKAALTAARTAANSIYIPPSLQAEIDLQSGTLHADERDYKTAYSYFFEAFEQKNALDDPKAVFCLKYMLLCKIMMNDSEEVPSIISGKAGLKYIGLQIDAIKAVAKAHQDRSLSDFQVAIDGHKAELVEDPIVHTHLSELYGTLLEQNLCRLIEPFTRVEIQHIADLIKLPLKDVEQKLSLMILDKKFAGTLDQGAGCLEVFEPPTEDAIYPTALKTFGNMERVIESLFVRSQKIIV
eukprot:CAMPEP_0117671490 /NCGR_PEP_ID=MMETSP0804-20121206/13362_1 /TAXON_ID=1074897 /ORGANISM="Tetraselmis astigmatica, Strain CCMP880" /LENGTH=436 /DNA_ID=CAMNT_0005479955 /DNA_START=44 /DNA_END=1354 /DNA_ORIENTATION=-